MNVFGERGDICYYVSLAVPDFRMLQLDEKLLSSTCLRIFRDVERATDRAYHFLM